LPYEARENEPVRLDEKAVQNAKRKIYDSFCNPTGAGADALPGRALGHLNAAGVRFRSQASRDEAEALRLCP
jgi:hypothetical protein